MEKIYIVKYSACGVYYEDYRIVELFATPDELKAISFVHKYNILLEKLKPHCNNMLNLIEEHEVKFENDNQENVYDNKIRDIIDTNRAFYTITELR